MDRQREVRVRVQDSHLYTSIFSVVVLNSLTFTFSFMKDFQVLDIFLILYQARVFLMFISFAVSWTTEPR